MPQEESRKNNSIAIAIIGLIGTIVTAVFGSPVLVEWVKSQQATQAPPAMVTSLPTVENQTPIAHTPIPGFTEQILIFREDFDNDNVSGFAYQGNWQVAKDKNNRVLEGIGPGKAIFGPSDFINGVIEFRVQLQEIAGDSATVNFREGTGIGYALSFTENQVVLGYRENDSAVQAFSSEASRALVFEKAA